MVYGPEEKTMWKVMHNGCVKTLMCILEGGCIIDVSNFRLRFYFKKVQNPAVARTVSNFDLYCEMTTLREIQEDLHSFKIQVYNLGDCPKFLLENIEKGNSVKIVLIVVQQKRQCFELIFYFFTEFITFDTWKDNKKIHEKLVKDCALCISEVAGKLNGDVRFGFIVTPVQVVSEVLPVAFQNYGAATPPQNLPDDIADLVINVA